MCRTVRGQSEIASDRRSELHYYLMFRNSIAYSTNWRVHVCSNQAVSQLLKSGSVLTSFLVVLLYFDCAVQVSAIHERDASSAATVANEAAAEQVRMQREVGMPASLAYRQAVL